MKMNLILVGSILMIAGLAAYAQQSADWKSLVETERAFARAASENGIRAAFLEFLDTEAIIFRPQPVPGRPVYEQVAPDSPTLLSWRPVFADVSRAGDLGYTTGPYEVYKNKQAKEPSAYGHYITVWKKQSGGPWKAVLDIGVSHGSSGSESAEVQAPSAVGAFSGKTLDPAELGQKQQLLRNREMIFSGTSESRGTAKAYEIYASDEVRLFREGQLPAVGRKDASILLARTETPVSWTCSGADISLSDDLAYAYGTGKLGSPVAGDPSHPAERLFSYMRIWRHEGTGAWRIVLDIAVPYPQ